MVKKTGRSLNNTRNWIVREISFNTESGLLPANALIIGGSYKMRLLFFLLILFSLGFTSIVPGYKEFSFFMSDDEVKGIISAQGYLSAEGGLREEVLQIYDHLELKDKFVYFDSIERRYYNFQFTDNIKGIKNYDYEAILHLTDQHLSDYKVITIPAGPGKVDEDWTHSFIFYNQEQGPAKGYKLFAVVLDFKGVEPSGPFNFVPNYLFKRLIEEVNKVFGAPQVQRRQYIDSMTEKFYLTYEHIYQDPGQAPPQNVREEAREKEDEYKHLRPDHDAFKIHTQVNVSYVVFKRAKANFKITYVTGDYLQEAKAKFTKFSFKDAGSKQPIPKLQ